MSVAGELGIVFSRGVGSVGCVEVEMVVLGGVGGKQSLRRRKRWIS